MKSFQQVKRAHEEIERCHIAIRRLYTAILDENDKFSEVLSQPQLAISPVHGAVQDFVCRRRRVNHLLLGKLNGLIHSHDFLGTCSRGVQLGRNTPHRGDSNQQVDAAMEEADEDIGEIGGDDADELVSHLINYVSDLALS